MTTSFSYMSNIPGVLGAFCIQRGNMEESSLPLIFDGEALGAATLPLAAVLEELSQLPAGKVTSALLSFGDVCVLLRLLPEQRVIGIVCQSHADLTALHPLLDRIPLPALPSVAAEKEVTPPLLRQDVVVQDAVPKMANAGTGNSGVSSAEVAAPPSDLTTPRAAAPPETTGAARSVPPRSSTRARVISANRPASITSDLRLRIQHELAQFVGPVAGLLVQDHLDQGASLLQLIERLAAEIEAPEDREVFLHHLNDLSPG